MYLADPRFTHLQHGANFPDLIELYNDSATARDLSGLGLTDNPSNPYKFTFPAGTSIGPRYYRSALTP